MGRQVVGQGPGTQPVTGGVPIKQGLQPEARPGTQIVMAPVVPRTHWDHCIKNTKAGAPCKMRPITGTPLCVGHTKQAEANDPSRTSSPSS